MLKKLKLLILTLGLGMSLVSMSAVPVSALFEGSKDDACNAINATSSKPAKDPCGSSSTKKVNGLITDVINILSVVIGVAAVIMIMIAGFKYITSQGDSAGISSAKNTLLYAVIGIIVVASAQLIVRFVLAKT